METVMIVVCITQMILNVLLYALVMNNDQKMRRKLQRQRAETLEWLQRQQEWMEVTQRQSTLQGLRNVNVRDDRTAAMKSLLQENGTEEKQ